MDGIREYLVQVTAAGLICGVVNMIAGKKGSVAASVRIMTVILMTVFGVILGGLADDRDNGFTTGAASFNGDIRFLQ